jgi:hypothetical protein
MTKHAELRFLASPEFDVEVGHPSDLRTFCVLVEVGIGMRAEVGEDVFRLYICTPSWLQQQLHGVGTEWGNYHLFVTHWDYKSVHAALSALVASISGQDWTSIAAKLSKWLLWEFDDYTPPKPYK